MLPVPLLPRLPRRRSRQPARRASPSARAWSSRLERRAWALRTPCARDGEEHRPTGTAQGSLPGPQDGAADLRGGLRQPDRRVRARTGRLAAYRPAQSAHSRR
ncbi:hypothetical protein BV508_21045, partial [Mycobacterium intermedium]